jgi:cysteine desulfurase
MPAIYLDHAATTPLDRRVARAMAKVWGNPATRLHAPGRAAAAAVETAREQVAALLGAAADEISFTSGTTESVNLALRGTAPGRLVTVATEHACVLETAAALAGRGCAVTVLPVDRNGRLDPARLARALRQGRALVSVMAVNNETGVIQDLAAIGRVCARHGALLHVDAAQAPGRIALDVAAMGIDLLSLGAHKMGGPCGIGALYHRRGIALAPLMTGGGQERGLRPGTLPAALATGLGKAALIARRELAQEPQRLAYLAGRFLSRLRARLDGVALLAEAAPRSPHILALEIDGIAAIDLIDALPGIALATGAACGSGRAGPSPVLTAMGLTAGRAARVIRVSLGRSTTEEELDAAATRLAEAALSLRSAARA